MLLDSLPCRARVFLLFGKFRNVPGEVKPSLPPCRSFCFPMFQDFLQDLLQMPERLMKQRAGRRAADKLPACISSWLPLQMTWDATAQRQGLFCTPAGSNTRELGQPRTRPWAKGARACLPAHWDTKPRTHLAEILEVGFETCYCRQGEAKQGCSAT